MRSHPPNAVTIKQVHLTANILRVKATQVWVGSLLFGTWLLCSPPAFSQQPHPEENAVIFVIHSWHDILWDRLWEKALHDHLSEDYRLVHFDLDAMRSSPQQLARNVETALSHYRALDPALVILGDDAALQSMALKLGDTRPVVYLGINHNPRDLIGHNIPLNITGVVERPLYERALRQIVQLLPEGADKVLFLSDADQEAAIVTNIKDIFKGNTHTRVGDVRVELVVTSQWEAWQAAVLSAQQSDYDAIVFDSRYLIHDARGQYVEPEPGVVRWMAKHSRLPLFNFYEDAIGPGLSSGGWVISGYGIGKEAARLVKDILENGKAPAQIFPVYYSKGEYIFSREQLRKWQIRLPPLIMQHATFAEDLHKLYEFDCDQYPHTICFD